jgi:transcriptional repressor NrdR
MRCPVCEHDSSRVMESRDLEDGASVRRRRECLDCGHRFTTYERVERPPLMVVKKDDRREPFNRQKIASGIYRACEKRPIPAARIEELITTIEQRVRGLGELEVPGGTIGEFVMEALMKLDDVAYVRFASVYRSFTDVASFETELARLKGKSQPEPM